MLLYGSSVFVNQFFNLHYTLLLSLCFDVLCSVPSLLIVRLSHDPIRNVFWCEHYKHYNFSSLTLLLL